MTDASSPDTPDRGWRGSPELWLDAAYAALIDSGVEAVKIMPLANTLKLSRTSFYWFFKDRKALLTALLDRWETTTTAPLVAATRHPAATQTEAMLNVISTFLSNATFDSDLEWAVRAWAQQDKDVQARVLAADTARLAALRHMLESWAHDPQDADVRARAIYLVQIGYISMRLDETTEKRLSRFPNYVEIYTGQRPSAEEMRRFRAQIGVTGPA